MFERMPPAVRNILIINVVLFVGAIGLDNKGINLAEILGLHYWDSIEFRPWQLITHAFMHGGVAHIAFNMIAVYSFGVILENILGSKRFLIVYFVSMLGAVFVQYAWQTWEVWNLTGTLHLTRETQEGIQMIYEQARSAGQYRLDDQKAVETGMVYFNQMVGASGALYGIMVAFATFFPNTEMVFLFVPYPIKAKYLVPVIIALDLYLGFSSFSWDPIAHFAHIGGALFGFLLIRFWKRKRNLFY